MNSTDKTKERSPAVLSTAGLGVGRWSSAYNSANLDVCRCYGALSYIEKAQKRLKETSCPLWLMSDLDEAHRRVQGLLNPLIRKRDALWLNP